MYSFISPIVFLNLVILLLRIGQNCSYVMDIGEADAFSERLKRELQALEAANVHAIMENETLIHQVVLFIFSLFYLMPANICELFFDR